MAKRGVCGRTAFGVPSMPVFISWSDAHYLIRCPGMADALMASFTAGDRWLVRHGSPGQALVPFLRDGTSAVSLEEALFLADCVAYDHDTPTLVGPTGWGPEANIVPVRPVVPQPGERSSQFYYDALETALGAAADIRVGDPVELRYGPEEDPMADFVRRFAVAAEPLAMYAMATRQVDILAEYLCLYRVLEWPNKDNGRAFIESHLKAVTTYDFGDLHAVTFNPLLSTQPTAVFSAYQDRASIRIRRLENLGLSPARIAAHLTDIRNAIAHGKSGVLTTDLGVSTADIGADLSLVKLLARLVIEELLP